MILPSSPTGPRPCDPAPAGRITPLHQIRTRKTTIVQTCPTAGILFVLVKKRREKRGVQRVGECCTTFRKHPAPPLPLLLHVTLSVIPVRVQSHHIYRRKRLRYTIANRRREIHGAKHGAKGMKLVQRCNTPRRDPRPRHRKGHLLLQTEVPRPLRGSLLRDLQPRQGPRLLVRERHDRRSGRGMGRHRDRTCVSGRDVYQGEKTLQTAITS